MKYRKYLSSDSVSLQEILIARDLRQNKQREYLNQYNLPLVVFTLNIVGPIKVFPLTIKTFKEGLRLINEVLSVNQFKIIKQQVNISKCGYEAYFVVDEKAILVKQYLSQIEETFALGRLFDIDVLDKNGDKLSRCDENNTYRKCLICDKIAFECSRNRGHSIEEILDKEISMMLDYFNDEYAIKLSKLSFKALCFEIKTTPKPGLVDLNNNGSHSDMDADLFIKSATSLLPFFKEFVYLGINNSELAQCDIFDDLRALGIKAERAMYKATNNINTHKGAIFIFSIVLATLGWLYAKRIDYSREVLIESIKSLTKNILRDFKNFDKKKKLSNGEKLYLKYNILGIRGEALTGFSSVINNAVIKMEYHLNKGYSLNDSGVITLLEIILLIDDTNLISRSDYKTLIQVKEKINRFILSNSNDFILFAHALDKEFIESNISPGGSADLLALTYFIHFFGPDDYMSG